MSPLVPRSAESLLPPRAPYEGGPGQMPPWPWQDERFKVPEHLTTIEEFVAWAREAYRDYPEYLRALLHPALPHTFEVTDG